MPDEPLFYTVSTYNRGAEQFETVGIFSKQDEAEAYAGPYRLSVDHERIGSVDGPMTMPTIVANLCRERLGQVAQALEKLGLDLTPK